MKKCTNCGLTYDDDKKFCKKCGAPLQPVYNINPQELAKKTVFEDRLKADPLNLNILKEYVLFLFNNLLFKETVTISLKILAINENDTSVKVLLFKSYIKLNQNKEAIEIGKQLLAKKPEDIFLSENLGDLLNEQGNHEEALKYYDKILSIQPENTSVRYKKAIILLHNNLIKEAIEIFKKLKSEGQNDRVTLIYTAIGEALNSEYKNTIDILIPILSSKDISLNDLDNNRGFLYLAYCLCLTNAKTTEINKWFSLINIHVLHENYSLFDEQTLAKTVLYVVNNELSTVKSSNAKLVLEDLTRDILTPIGFYFTKNTNPIISKILYNIGTKQAEFKLYSDSVNSLKRSCDLMPEEDKYSAKYNEIQKLLDNQSRRKKKKTLIGIGIALVAGLLIFLSVIAYNNYKLNKTWELAKNTNTFESYQYYLNEYPKGKYNKVAESLQEQALWKESKSKNTVRAYNDYMSLYPNGKYDNDAKYERDNVAWNTFSKNLTNIKQNDKQKFISSFNKIKSYDFTEDITKTDKYILSKAIEQYLNGDYISAISVFKRLKYSKDNTVKEITTSILEKPAGKRQFNTKPFVFTFWYDYEIEIKLVKTVSTHTGIQVFFSMKDIGKSAFQIPFQIKKHDAQFVGDVSKDNVHIVDNLGKRFGCLNVTENGKRIKLNENGGITISFDTGQTKILQFYFPQISSGASTINFISPGSPGYTGTWFWKNIVLKNGIFD